MPSVALGTLLTTNLFLVIRGHLRPIPKAEHPRLYLFVLSSGAPFCDKTDRTAKTVKIVRIRTDKTVRTSRIKTDKTDKTIRTFVRDHLNGPKVSRSQSS